MCAPSRVGEAVAPVRTELLRAATWAASRYALEGHLVDPVAGATLPAWDRVRALRDWVVESVAPEDLARIDSGLDEVRRRGVGAQRQRAVYGRGGRFEDVIELVHYSG